MDADRSLPWVLRSDLEIIAAEDGAWVIKDPLQLRYFRLQAEEMALLRLLDGRSSWGQILERMTAQFRRPFVESNLAKFLASTVNSSLLVSREIGLADRMSATSDRERSSAWQRRLASAISFRWRGVDPTWILSLTNRLFGWCFRPASLVVSSAFLLLVAALVVVRCHYWKLIYHECRSC